jgi:hypothetical protein
MKLGRPDGNDPSLSGSHPEVLPLHHGLSRTDWIRTSGLPGFSRALYSPELQCDVGAMCNLQLTSDPDGT